ncbi:hypothetical protein Tco_1490757, partial [Tanacetum coccineum]
MAQQIIPAAQLVPKYQSIRRCNNYDMLKSIPCSPECNIIRQILLDHPLSYALTTTANFKLDTQEITYTVDMFRDTLHLLVGTLNNLFVAPVNIEIIESFMQRVGYQGFIDKLFHVVVNRTNVDYAALLWWDFINCVFQKKDVIQIDEDYHSIKDDIPLMSLYTTGNVQVRGMLISDALLTEEIRATDDYTEYKTVFMKVVVLMNQPQPVVSTLRTHRSTPRAYRTPTLSATSPQGKKSVGETSSPRKSLKVTIRKKKQSTTLLPPPGEDRERDEIAEATLLNKLDEEEIEKIVKGEEDEESYASEFADSMHNDDDDSGNKIEPESHKEHSENVNDDDDDEIEKEKKDDNKDDDVEKTDEVVEEKNNDDHIDHTLVGSHATASIETRNEQMHTPIPTPNRSPRKDLSLDKIFFEELTATVSPTTATTSKDSSRSKSKRGFTLNKTKILPGSIAGMCRRRGQIHTHIKTKFVTHEFFMGKIREVLDHCNNAVPEMTFAKTNEMIKEEMTRLVHLAVN